MKPEETESEFGDQQGGLKRRLMSPEERQKFGHQNKWHKDAQGRDHPPELVSRFIDEYCLVPETQRPTQKEWAERNGVAPRTVAGWKMDERVIAEWNRRLSMSYGHPDRIRSIVENLQATAATPGPQAVRAAETYFKFLGLMAPPEMVVNVQPPPKDLSELDEKELVELVRGDE